MSKINSSGNAVVAGTGDIAVPVFIAVSGAGTSGSVSLATLGQATCTFDGATTAGHFVVASTTTGGDCHDAGAATPTSGWIVGQVMTTNGTSGTYQVTLSQGYNAAGGGSGTINAAAQYSLPYYSAAGSSTVIGGLAPPSDSQVYTLTQLTGAAPAWALPGIAIDPQAGSYTLLSGDRGKEVSVTSASAATITIPQAGSTGFTNNYYANIPNLGAGRVTLTPTTSTINGTASQIVPLNWVAYLSSDSTNYFAHVFPTIQAFADCNGTGKAETFTAATGQFGCNTGSGGSANFCTDNPAPGVLSAMNAAGHVYCLAGAYTFSTAQTISANNVKIRTTPGTTITRTSGTTDLFDVSGTNDTIEGGGVLDGGSFNGGPLVSDSGTNLTIRDMVVQNFGTAHGAIENPAAISGLEVDNLHCTSASHRCISLSSPGSNAISNVIIRGGFYSGTGVSGALDALIDIVEPGGASAIKNITVEDTTLSGQNGSGNLDPMQIEGPSAAGGIDSVKVVHNHCFATAALHSCYKIFGVDHFTVADNTARDEGFALTPYYFGDLYDGAVTSNTAKLSGVFGDGINAIDTGRVSFTANVIDGGDMLIGTAAGNCDQFSIHDNIIKFPANANFVGLTVDSNTNTFHCNDGEIGGNTFLGTGTAGQLGMSLLTASGGTLVNTHISPNMFINLPTAINIGTGVTNTQIDTQSFDTVTTHISNSGTNTSIQSGQFTLSGALVGGTATVTFPNGGFVSATSYTCLARDTTTPANALTQGTFTATTLVLTGTGTDGYTISCWGQR